MSKNDNLLMKLDNAPLFYIEHTAAEVIVMSHSPMPIFSVQMRFPIGEGWWSLHAG